MTECYMPSVDPGTQTQSFFVGSPVSSAAIPSYDSLAKAEVDRMLKDEDVQQLPPDVWQATQRFSTEIVRSFPLSGTTRIAVFGDLDESAGEIVFLDRGSARQVELTVKAGLADVWMRGPTEKLSFDDVRPDQVSLLSAIFSRLR